MSKDFSRFRVRLEPRRGGDVSHERGAVPPSGPEVAGGGREAQHNDGPGIGGGGGGGPRRGGVGPGVRGGGDECAAGVAPVGQGGPGLGKAPRLLNIGAKLIDDEQRTFPSYKGGPM